MKKILFVHGGPGMNSFAEKAILEAPLKERGFEPHFWNEPSRQRPDGDPFDPANAYQGLIDSVRRTLNSLRASGDPLHLVCLSFAVHPVFEVLRADSEGIASLTIVSPVFQFKNEIWRIAQIAEKNLNEKSPEASKKLFELRKQSQTFFDVPMQEALQLMATDDQLFFGYWNNKNAMASYFAEWERNGVTMDLESFVCSMQQFAQFRDVFLDLKMSIPTQVVFGCYDPVVDRLEEEDLCKRVFSSLRVLQFESSGHFPHLEESERFLDIVSNYPAAES